MPINPHVYKPESIRNLTEIEEILRKMDLYKKEYTPKSKEIGVIYIQNRQIGGICRIVSIEESKKWLSKQVFSNTPEFGVNYWPRSYFEELRTKFKTSQ